MAAVDIKWLSQVFAFIVMKVAKPKALCRKTSFILGQLLLRPGMVHSLHVLAEKQ